MKRRFVIAAEATLISSLVMNLAPLIGDKAARFTPPNVATATDIPYPADVIAVGVVTLLLGLDSNAQIQNVQTVRDFPSFTSVVRTATQKWTFTPGKLDGNPVPSSISVTVIFNPSSPGGPAMQNLALSPPESITPDASQFAPPQITSASFAKYPPKSVSGGTIILDITVGESSQISGVRVVRGVASLTAPAVTSVKTWGFNAATLRGKPAASQVIVAFVFQSNTP
jgi:energy-converting hydrogenase Eha subunit A